MKYVFSLGPAAFVLAFATFNGPSVAAPLDNEFLTPQSSIENRCRAAIRGEIKGPACEKISYVWHGPDGCEFYEQEQPFFMNKVIQCVAHGGPGRAARHIDQRSAR